MLVYIKMETENAKEILTNKNNNLEILRVLDWGLNSCVVEIKNLNEVKYYRRIGQING